MSLPADLCNYLLPYFDSSGFKVWRSLCSSELRRVSSYLLIHANIGYPSSLPWPSFIFTPPECIRIPTPLCYLSNEHLVTYRLQPRPHLVVSDLSGVELYVSLKQPMAKIQTLIPQCMKIVQDSFLVEGGILHLNNGEFCAVTAGSTAATTATTAEDDFEPKSQRGVMFLTVNHQVNIATLLCGSVEGVCVVHTTEGISLCVYEPFQKVLQQYLDLLPKPIPEEAKLGLTVMAASSYKRYLLPYPIVHDEYNTYSLCHLMLLVRRGRELTVICGWMHYKWSEVIDYQVRYDTKGYSLLVLREQTVELYRFPPL